MSGLTDLLAHHRDVLVARFFARAAQELGGRNLSQGALPEFLDDLLAALQAGVLPPVRRMDRHAHAEAHGSYRQESGAELTSLVREYGLLRDCLYALLEEAGETPSVREVRILDECVSAASTDAVAAYVARKDLELREGGVLLQAILDQAPVAIYVKDLQGRYELVNAHFCTQLKVTPEQAVGHTDLELFPRAQAESVRENDRRVLEANAPLQSEEVVGHADGPHTYISIKFPVPGPDGRPEAVGGISTDVTARKLAEDAQAFFLETGRALAESLDFETTLRTIAQLAVTRLADFCMLDLLGEDGQLRRAQLAARDPALLPLLERTRPYAPRLGSGSPVAQVLQSGTPMIVARITPEWMDASAVDAEHRALLEELAPTSAVVAPLVAQGRTLGVINLASRDPKRSYGPRELELVQGVADRAATALSNAHLYREAQEAVRTREDVLAIVSHDLKNPLGIIGMAAGQLLRHAGTDEAGRRSTRHAHAILRSAERMNRLIRDLLDLASIESGTLALEPRELDADALLQEAAETLCVLAADKGLHLEVHGPGPGPGVLADRERVMQVLGNLVGNALKFSPPGTAVHLRAVRQEGLMRFEVEDAGTGISPDALPHIFERFWKARATATKGTGLGLFICRGIIEGHGGRIWAESAPGEGACILFTLPLAA